MPTRARQSTATPASRRPASELPAYEKPSFPLNPAAQRAIAQLKAGHNFRKLDGTLQEAQDALSNTAAEINDRLTAREAAVKKRKAEQSSQDAEPGANDELEKELDSLRDKVERMTQRMDESMRKMIDGRHGAQSISTGVDAAANDARENASTQASTQVAATQRQRRRPVGLDDDSDDDNGDNDYQDFEPTDPAANTQTRPSPLDVFRTHIGNAKTRYQNHTFTARYAQDNDYRNFKKVVHDARYPDESVPLAHESEWFREQDQAAPAPGVTTRGRADLADDDDDDIAVSKAAISTKCPLTLKEFTAPLTSKKCPHSFESEAILQMIDGSNLRMAGNIRYVQCPVGACSQHLTRQDLHTDKVLIRKIKRLQDSKRLEDEDIEGEGTGCTQGSATIIEDEDGADVDDVNAGRVVPQTQVKPERGTATSASPTSTAQRTSTAVVDLGSDTPDEAEEDDEMEE